MSLRRISLLSLVLFSLLSASLHAEKKKQEAKDYYENAGKENDPVKKVQLACEAARLEPKTKKYGEECSRLQAALTQSDANSLQAAKSAFSSNQFDAAESQAKAVTTHDEKTHAQAVELIGQIENAKHLSQLESAWNRGDFDGVRQHAQKLTDPKSQEMARKTLDLLELYISYTYKAKNFESDNPAEAIRQYTAAYKINPKGPVDTQSKIAQLTAAMQVKKAPVPVVVNAPVVAPVIKPAGNTAAMLGSAKEAEAGNRLQEALADYQGVLAVEPFNRTAKDGVSRLQPQLAAADRAVVKKGIKDFYDFKLNDAQQELDAYLKATPPPANAGVAYFYLGATLLEQAMLATPQSKWQGTPAEVQTAFHQARQANYTPAKKYVSPALMKAWDATQ